jgi:hypothetical protein
LDLGDAPTYGYLKTKQLIFFVYKLAHFFSNYAISNGMPPPENLDNILECTQMLLHIYDSIESGTVLFRQRINHFIRLGKLYNLLMIKHIILEGIVYQGNLKHYLSLVTNVIKSYELQRSPEEQVEVEEKWPSIWIERANYFDEPLYLTFIKLMSCTFF